MTDESTTQPISPFPPAATEQEAPQPTVAFCQQCGRNLTASTVRTVGSGIFCEPCARTAVPFSGSPTGAAAGGYTPVHSPGVDGVSPPSAFFDQPNPVLAGLLGFIPGVGAMYNGQYAKGVIHLVVFVVLTSLADNLNWVLWWFVWGWIFYQAFEAYHTAQARRDGQPLPDPFGWNDLGDRFGFSRTSPPVSSPPGAATRPAAGSSGAAQGSASHRASVYSTAAATTHFSSGTQESTVPDPLATQVPRSTPASASAPPPSPAAFTAAEPTSAPHNTAPHTSVPFTSAPTPSAPYQPQFGPTYTGVPSPAAIPAEPLPLAQRFPAGAAWLLGLGILFLLANLAPGWRLEGRWLVPALLALLALWTGSRKVQALSGQYVAPGATAFANLAEGLVGPVTLLTLAILLALQNADRFPLRHSWPVLLIVWGALLLVARARPAAPPVPGPGVDEAPRPGDGPIV